MGTSTTPPAAHDPASDALVSSRARRAPADIDGDPARNRIYSVRRRPSKTITGGRPRPVHSSISGTRPAGCSRNSGFDRDGAANAKGVQRSNQFASREPAPNQDK